MTRNERARVLIQRLSQRYPEPESALEWENPWHLLVATVLSAQCTDARVNQVTPALFARWPGPAELALADVQDIEAVIQSTGLFRTKSRNLRDAAEVVIREHGGHVPQSMAELTALPGIGRKTANIILSHAFRIHEGIAVDTHVKRLARRLGLTRQTDPNRIEKELMPLFPRESWGDINHFLVFFGREICLARSPRCPDCPLRDICPRIGVDKGR